MKKISEESAPSERKGIYKIGLAIAVFAIIAWFGFNDLTNQAEVPAPKDTQLLQAYAIINNSTETMRENSYNMTRSQTVGLADWLSDADEGGPGESCCSEPDRDRRCMCFANGDEWMIHECQSANLHEMSDEEYRDYVKKTSPCRN